MRYKQFLEAVGLKENTDKLKISQNKVVLEVKKKIFSGLTVKIYFKDLLKSRGEGGFSTANSSSFSEIEAVYKFLGRTLLFFDMV